MPTEGIGPPFDSCDVCGRPIGEHRVSHDEPAPGLTEAVFGGVDTSGFYCPVGSDGQTNGFGGPTDDGLGYG